MNGIEWIVEAHGCAPERLRDLPRLKRLFERIIADLQLRPVGGAYWHRFPETGGISGLCLLAESHLACHTFPEFGSLCLNLFCCVPRGDWDFEAGLRFSMAATAVTVRRIVRPYKPMRESDRPSPEIPSAIPAGSPVE